MRAEEICTLAKKSGMSYGQYVFQHREELRDAVQWTRRAKRRCAFCGKSTEGSPAKRRYCSDFCRLMAWKKLRGDLR